MKLKGAQVVIEVLKEMGVDNVFGIPGGAVIPIYDALYDSDIRHILATHEQMAAHMADGYARATGKVGVCIATSGPGATNLVTGIANAYMDSVPVVAITGQVPTYLIGKDAFQEVDITGITMPITKHNFVVKSPEKLADTLREAFAIAKSGRPGPVLVDIPKDIQNAEIEYERKGEIEYKNGIKEIISEESLSKAVELILESKKPVIFAGGGVIWGEACGELLEFAEKTNIPVATSLMGLGCFPGDHPLSLGLIGMHGSRFANLAVYHSDLVIAVGTRFSDRVAGKAGGLAPKAKFIHIDIDAAEIGKNVEVDVGIVGKIKKVLKLLADRVPSMERREWLEEVEELRVKHGLRYKKDDMLRPQWIVEKIQELSNDDLIIATEVGQNQMWAAQFYKFKKPRTFVTSGGLGAMGFGLPASIGAQVGRPDKRVVNIAGDGSLRMNIHALETAAFYNIPVIIVLLNNQALGMVRQWQYLFNEKRFSQTDLNPHLNFAKIASDFGVEGIRVTTKEDFEKAFKKAYSEKKPFMIECIIDKDEMVLPFIPAGGTVEDTIA
ncbi:biosynthetic-type acetolactate synthase large subunit [Caldanaerobacter subterraneus]|uniref:Acetolactate synthase n=2 Tax=Caldanaerobacter subterraneus TaxID=911092 RepID=Q8RDJ8_CALS4|nr:biosynthetic-type acetolactate synthase large subunit [Caldanaerobacter subterraneus]AAM23338.1 Thiamine pyrophosphate-requiring enzymes (acetolactate synthase, pyruvate dehydrogenase (cytochrome), glyoxylate carboligase, phosphonopyruvate decarboxylase) [Caldanaerobacter subterraneus subsp. tengcongensis MB4]MCS3917188.1 acetolactate synthase-1/2/3 large subunit [Caldanaerobacter subterraneus subsp. tengcongensis MB4]TCO64171.1 acetolactate synthase large subunit [Caldanaerobacter subterrane